MNIDMIFTLTLYLHIKFHQIIVISGVFVCPAIFFFCFFTFCWISSYVHTFFLSPSVSLMCCSLLTFAEMAGSISLSHADKHKHTHIQTHTHTQGWDKTDSHTAQFCCVIKQHVQPCILSSSFSLKELCLSAKE